MMPQLLYPGLTSLLFLLFALQISAHMMISSPPPLGSSSNPNLRSSDIDYNLKDPLSPSGLTYPCGPNFDLYSLSPQGNPVATWAAGSSQSFTLDGGASHNGGSCQASLSIDGGKSFKVLRSYEGGCPLKRNYQFSIPADVPATKKAVFAWTWFNQIGNREMYMNCAVVDITPGSGGKGGWAKKPEVFKANIGNGCTTVERFDVEFPNPGDDVARGGEGNFASPVGDCGTVNRGADSGAGEGSGNTQGGGTDSGNGGANQNPDSPPAGDSPGSSTTDPTRPSQPNSGGKSTSLFTISPPPDSVSYRQKRVEANSPFLILFSF
ncbi:uncharacterized protein PODANS_2_7840 [Podospora anserina S mat+]|uniref:Podospora anserina S mat+ genomic DNA chromosome 2, supercontig 2 n=1 Tax=Podospora anserina (strain S / ATCC MYA-4624 / DSM 980 / FGSC 10383) TaxID=515849 RepID=B2B6I0_PODAN|nr:uncharacterized protein PODANS_2_7840 [Podospora anserina S mat+]CAP73406.1 unnamed protein product [Podospora anserina S mat+]CDP25808.1 Putative protein of unknown function [Podospora anserina S mat+]